jgi:hypothetical protein
MKLVCRSKLGTFIGTLALTIVLSSIGSNARADLLAYEGFDYTPDTLLISGGVGLNGGTGWSGAWDETQAASFSTVTRADSLEYVDGSGNTLVTNGGKLLNTGIGDGTPTGSQTSQPGRSLSERRASPTEGATISTWISFLGQRLGPVNPESDGNFAGTYRRGANLALFDLGGDATQVEKFNIGSTSSVYYEVSPGPPPVHETRFQSRAPGVNAAVVVEQPFPPNPTGSATAGQVRDQHSPVKFADGGLIVIRIDHLAGTINATDTAGNDNFYAWVNPALDSVPSDLSAFAQYVSADIVAAAAAITPVPPTPYNNTDGGEINFNRIRLFAGNIANAGVTPFAEWYFDELRIGETYADVTPFIPAAAGTPGDYNDNDKVDLGDYTTWRNHLGEAFQLDNEGTGITPGMVTPEDFDVWKAHFNEPGAGGGGVASGVPEPGTILLAAAGLIAALGVRRRTRTT